MANLDFAAVGLLLTRNHAKQRRLTGAVRSDDADDRAWRHFETQVIDQHAVAKRLGDVDELNHLLTQTLCYGDKNLLCLVAFLVVEIGQLFKAGDTRLALGLTTFGVLTDPVEFFLQRFGTGVFTFLLFLEAVLLLL